jgi:hypothetical protein
MNEGSSDHYAAASAVSPTPHSQHGRQELHSASSVRGGKVLERLVHQLGAAVDSPSAK